MTDAVDLDTTANLAALAASISGAQTRGDIAPQQTKSSSSVDVDPTTEARQKKVTELKTRYKAGSLGIDEKALASKLVASLLNDNLHPSPRS